MFLFQEAKLVITADWRVYLVVWALSQNITIVIKEKAKGSISRKGITITSTQNSP